MKAIGSMAPTSGGQYHWVSEFAPAQFQKILSYAVGWLSSLGWQIAVISTAFQAGVQIQGLLVLNYDWYVFERWHGTLLVIAVVTFGCFFNIFLVKWLPTMEVLLLIFHVCGFFCVLVPLLVLSKKSPSSEVWTGFFDSGWGSQGLSTLVGSLGPVLPLLGADAAGTFIVPTALQRCCS
jgi:amino acid transporter